MSRVFNIVLVFLFSCGLLCFQSCKTYQNVPYFKDVPDSARISIKNAQYKELTIQPGDILAINIMTIDPSANAIFSQVFTPSASAGGTGANPVTAAGGLSSGIGGLSLSNSSSGYLVDKSGEIEIPLLGKFLASGISTDSLKVVITAKLSEYYKTPAVIVRFSNLKVSVLGEVARPGSYTLTNEKNTILDALSMAGDLTVFGKRENALLLRDSAGITKITRFSLNSKSLMTQDFFYLRQNDVIYIEPGKGKAASLDAANAKNYALIASILSVIIVIASRL